MSETFRVDLRGVVDLLSHHLYTSPQVYVRELLQNAVDAITAAGALERPGRVVIEPPEVTGDGTLRIHDNGVGLTEPQVHELLATIGRSSKRDELGFARHEFLGQFGIGLLSCFMVADEIRVLTRHGENPTVLWTGFADGRYTVATADPREHRSEPGTTVMLVPRVGAEHWLTEKAVVDLARYYGGFLPVEITVGSTPITEAPAPWQTTAGESASARRARLAAYCHEVFGFEPFDVVEIAAAEAGVRGVAFVLPMPANPTVAAAHRIYLKQMLLSTTVEGLLPEWAFFVRCVADTSELRPTASREALYEDGLLEATRIELGDVLRGWLVALASRDPARLGQFLRIHHLGVKALALHDDEMLRLVNEYWPMSTNVGPLTMAEFRDRYGVLRFCPRVDEFRQMAPVAAAQGVALINAGYVYDTELITRLAAVDTGVVIEQVGAGDLTTHLERLDAQSEDSLRPFLVTADRALRRLGCEVMVRAFDPPSLPALYLLDQDTAFQADLKDAHDHVDETWSAILSGFQEDSQPLPQLVLNHRNALVRQVIGLGEAALTSLCVEGLYVQALLLGHHPLRPADTAVLNQSFLGLIAKAVAGGGAQ